MPLQCQVYPYLIMTGFIFTYSNRSFFAAYFWLWRNYPWPTLLVSGVFLWFQFGFHGFPWFQVAAYFWLWRNYPWPTLVVSGNHYWCGILPFLLLFKIFLNIFGNHYRCGILSLLLFLEIFLKKWISTSRPVYRESLMHLMQMRALTSAAVAQIQLPIQNI